MENQFAMLLCLMPIKKKKKTSSSEAIKAEQPLEK